MLRKFESQQRGRCFPFVYLEKRSITSTPQEREGTVFTSLWLATIYTSLTPFCFLLFFSPQLAIMSSCSSTKFIRTVLGPALGHCSANFRSSTTEQLSFFYSCSLPEQTFIDCHPPSAVIPSFMHCCAHHRCAYCHSRFCFNAQEDRGLYPQAC